MNYRNKNLINKVLRELEEATSNYCNFNSPHEGYAIIKEELDELWIEIKKSPKNRNYELMERSYTINCYVFKIFN